MVTARREPSGSITPMPCDWLLNQSAPRSSVAIVKVRGYSTFCGTVRCAAVPLRTRVTPASVPNHRVPSGPSANEKTRIPLSGASQASRAKRSPMRR